MALALLLRMLSRDGAYEMRFALQQRELHSHGAEKEVTGS